MPSPVEVQGESAAPMMFERDRRCAHAHCTSRRFAMQSSTMQSSTLLTRLDQETRHRHGVADADRLALLTSTVTSEEYRWFLERVYGFEAAVETAIQMTPGLGEVIDLRSRVRLRLLKSDLTVFGVTNPAKLPRCKSVAPFHAHHDALGWMYVLDRNQLLHGVLRRHLEKQLPAQLAIAGTYLAGSDRAAASRRRELGDVLEAVARTAVDADRVIVAAHAGFRCQRHWFAEIVPPRLKAA
jgi:heme oxygenase